MISLFFVNSLKTRGVFKWIKIDGKRALYLLFVAAFLFVMVSPYAAGDLGSS